MEKWMIVYVLPLEVWMDIFCYPWISRKDFGKIIDKIGNFKFAEHAQFYLHEWGKRTLKMRELYFDENGLHKYVDYKPYRLYMDVPQTPLPENIRFFDCIQIDHFDAKTVDFLRKIDSLLANNVEIDVTGISAYSLRKFRTIWTNLAPLLGESWSLCCRNCALPAVRECFGEDLAKIKVLEIIPFTSFAPEIRQENVDFIMDWLTTQPNKNGPKFCEYRSDNGFTKQIFIALQKQFLAANAAPCTFALNLMVSYSQLDYAEFHLANGAGEELHGVWKGTNARGERIFQVTRHRANCNGQLQEWIGRMGVEKGSNGCIQIFHPTIGSIGVDQMNALSLEEEVQQQQPSTSKEAHESSN